MNIRDVVGCQYLYRRKATYYLRVKVSKRKGSKAILKMNADELTSNMTLSMFEIGFVLIVYILDEVKLSRNFRVYQSDFAI